MTDAGGVSYVVLALALTTVVCGDGIASPVKQVSPSVPMSARASQSIGARSYGAAERGRENYATYCTPCHGPRGEGDGPLADVLVPRPARHSDAAFMSALSDEHLFRLLKHGGPALGKSPLMGVWGRILSDEQIWDLIAFIRSLARQGD